MKSKYTCIGGQALIEGIMMKSPEKTAMAVRKPNGEIYIENISENSLRNRHKFFALPVIRGVVAFVESLIGGYKTMMRSADISGFTDLTEETAESETDGEVTENTEESEKNNSALMTVLTVIGTVLGVALAVVLFLLLPRLCVSLLEYLFKTKFSPAAHSAIEQGIKLVVLVLYMYSISFMKDIRRVFMYHGAEHKTIFCYEHGLDMTVENVRKERRFHPRCGTSFMILMILVSFIVSFAVQILFRGVYDNAAVWVGVKILMIPLICGLGFEILRICGKYDNLFTKIIAAPGLWLQRITTKEPDDDMIEIAIAALKACEPAIPDVDRKGVEDGEQ